MVQQYDPAQKVVVTEQTTGKYGVILYDVEESENGYMYGVDEIRDNFYVDDVNFEDELVGNTVRTFDHEYEDDEYEKVIIESESIQVRSERDGDRDIAVITWSPVKDSLYKG